MDTPASSPFTLIVPAYNEGAGLKERVSAILEEAGPRAGEVLVVDDGSADGSTAGLADLAGVTLVRHARNLGYGAALKTGIRQAHYPLIAIIDADGTYPARELGRLAAAIDDGAAMAVGARTGEEVRIPLVRRPAKWFLRTLAAWLVGTPIPDLNSGLRVFRRRDTLRFWHLLPRAFSFTSTLTLCLLQDGARVDFLPVSYARRAGRSKIRPLRDTYRFFLLIIRLVVYFNPLKVLVPLALLFLAAGIFVGFFSHFALGATMDVATSVLVFLGVQCFVLGLLADLMIARSRSDLPDLEPEANPLDESSASQ